MMEPSTHVANVRAVAFSCHASILYHSDHRSVCSAWKLPWTCLICGWTICTLRVTWHSRQTFSSLGQVLLVHSSSRSVSFPCPRPASPAPYSSLSQRDFIASQAAYCPDVDRQTARARHQHVQGRRGEDAFGCRR